MKTITIKEHLEMIDCDCCGWYQSGYVQISFDDNEVSFNHDGHFGSGEWDSTKESAIILAIGLLSSSDCVVLSSEDWWHTVTVQESDGDASCYYIEVEGDPEDLSGWLVDYIKDNFGYEVIYE